MDTSDRIDRRSFLGLASASAVALAAPLRLGAAEASGASAPPKLGDPRARILELELLTAAPLAAMKAFYQGTLGLPAFAPETDRLRVQAGSTSITFVAARPGDGRPFYHFAFNIPENKLLAARRWQLDRTPLLPMPERLRLDGYPDVADFRHWNAHSIYFLDPGGNVVEHIARHDLDNGASGDFSAADILCASEIGLIVDDVSGAARELRKAIAGLDQYRGGDEQFLALGDEHGLLLVMKRGRHLNFAADDSKAAAVFRTTAGIRGVVRTTYAVPDFPYEISVRA